MVPVISELEEDDKFLRFRISNINVSLANGLRRIIIGEIPTLVFRTAPHDKDKSEVYVNTSRMNNELIKQRLSCIPIHITDTAFAYDEHIVEIHKKNDSQEIQYVTTGDFKIKNTTNDMYLSDAAVRSVFPPNKITGDFIDLVRLRPQLSDTMPGEELHMTCLLDIGNAGENGSFNVASTCSYSATKDPIKANKAWIEKAKALKKEGLTSEEIADKKQDWESLDAKRITIPDSFDFIIETVGPFPNMSIVEKACAVMSDKLKKFENDVQSVSTMVAPSTSTIENCFDIKLVGEGYTLGKVIEFILYSKYYDKPNKSPEKILTYCGFRKPHPHIDESIIRLGFKNTIEPSEVIAYLVGAAQDANAIYDKIQEEFSSE
tara:strand:+ start:5399 stop:6526 length:1128 start_codon:yes stop_codon:yes gene_type:complete